MNYLNQITRRMPDMPIKACCLFIFFISTCFSGSAQDYFEISLQNEKIEISNRQFYIYLVQDIRTDKNSLGEVYFETANIKIPARFAQGLEKALSDYFDNALPFRQNQVPIVIKISELWISENIIDEEQQAIVHLEVSFYYKNEELLQTVHDQELSGSNATQLHEENIRAVLKEAIFAFNEINWFSRIDVEISEENEEEISEENQKDSVNTGNESYDFYAQYYDYEDQNKPTKDKTEESNRDVISIGYQIGGWTLIGADYEFRIFDFAGLHLGAGFKGYTAGFKLHINKKKNSSFFNFSYKDGGFGLIRTIGVEYGGRINISKTNDLAIVIQGGIAGISHIDDEFQQLLFGNEKSPEFILSFGAGFSF